MKTVIVCNDCGTCCGEDNKISEINLNKDFQLIKTSCLGLCPENKISTIVLDSSEINKFKIVPLTVKEINIL